MQIRLAMTYAGEQKFIPFTYVPYLSSRCGRDPMLMLWLWQLTVEIKPHDQGDTIVSGWLLDI